MRIQTWPHSGLDRLLETYITLTVWSVHPPLATFTLLSFLTSNLIITTPSSIFTFDTFTTLLHNHNQPHSLNTNTMFAKQIITSILLSVAMTSVTAAPTQSGAIAERDIAVKGINGGDFFLKQGDVDLVSPSSSHLVFTFDHHHPSSSSIIIAFDHHRYRSSSPSSSITADPRHLSSQEHSLRRRQNGGNAYTGASGMADGGDATTYQGGGGNGNGLLGGGGLLNLKAANFGGNGGRGGQSTTGNAYAGKLASVFSLDRFDCR